MFDRLGKRENSITKLCTYRTLLLPEKHHQGPDGAPSEGTGPQQAHLRTVDTFPLVS